MWAKCVSGAGVADARRGGPRTPGVGVGVREERRERVKPPGGGAGEERPRSFSIVLKECELEWFPVLEWPRR